MADVSETGLEPIGAVQRTRTGREATEPMREDIRLLGAILGDTVREQNGDEVFDLVERARVASFRVRRSEIERAEVAGLFEGIDIHQAIPVIRAFSHFALLANVAEDIHRERRRAIHVAAGKPPQDSSLAATYLKLDAAELDAATVADGLAGALVSPVITAHPTETRRRTVFDTQHRITQLMRLRAHGHTETDDGRDIELELRRQVLTLWQTALIRLSRLQIHDEIAVGLRYYQAAFFDVMPQVNAEVREALRSRWPDADLLPEPILRPGSWIGGDRDGNPNVTADVVRLATGSAAYTALGHYFAEMTALEQELSMSARLVAVTDELAELAKDCDERPRADEPYRRALRVIRAGSPQPPLRSWIASRRTCSTWTSAIRDTGGVAGRPRHRRRVTARQRQRRVRRRPAGPIAGSRARLRFSSVRSGHAAELRCPRGGGRRVAGLGRRACGLPLTERSRTGRHAGRRAGHPQAADRRTATNCPNLPAKNSPSSARPPARRHSVRRRCPTTSSRCASRSPTCWRPRSC